MTWVSQVRLAALPSSTSPRTGQPARAGSSRAAGRAGLIDAELETASDGLCWPPLLSPSPGAVMMSGHHAVVRSTQKTPV